MHAPLDALAPEASATLIPVPPPQAPANPFLLRSPSTAAAVLTAPADDVPVDRAVVSVAPSAVNPWGAPPASDAASATGAAEHAPSPSADAAENPLDVLRRFENEAQVRTAMQRLLQNA
jgi:hypothetical protein